MPPRIHKPRLPAIKPSLHHTPDEPSSYRANGIVDLAWEKWRLSDLSISENHPRNHDPKSIERICKNIRSFRIFAPVLITKDGQIIDGETHYLAYQRLGLKEIPVIVVDHLSEVQRSALGLLIYRI